MKRVALGLTVALGLLLALWASQPAENAVHVPQPASPEVAAATSTDDACCGGSHAPIELAAAATSELNQHAVADAEPPRATTWVVLRVNRERSEVARMIHKDALPYAAGPPTADAHAVRFRLVEADGSEVTGPASWPQLCPCEKTTSHNRGCIRIPHEGSVRLRLPRIQGPSTVVIERRSSHGWSALTTLEVDA